MAELTQATTEGTTYIITFQLQMTFNCYTHYMNKY